MRSFFCYMYYDVNGSNGEGGIMLSNVKIRIDQTVTACLTLAVGDKSEFRLPSGSFSVL